MQVYLVPVTDAKREQHVGGAIDLRIELDVGKACRGTRHVIEDNKGTLRCDASAVFQQIA